MEFRRSADFTFENYVMDSRSPSKMTKKHKISTLAKSYNFSISRPPLLNDIREPRGHLGKLYPIVNRGKTTKTGRRQVYSRVSVKEKPVPDLQPSKQQIEKECT